MVKRRRPPSQGWRTFLRNHAPTVAAMDLFVVPTIGFDLLYAFVIVRLDRRDLAWITCHPWRTSSPLRPSLSFWYTQGATSNWRIYRQSDAGDYIASSCSSSGDLTRLRLAVLFCPFQIGVKSRRA